MFKKISVKEVNQRLYNKFANQIKITEYKKMTDYAHFVCNLCNYEWDALPFNVIENKYGCSNCVNEYRGSSQRLSLDQVKNRIRNRKCILLSTEYKNNNQLLEIQYPCGHINELSLANFNKENGCKKCKEKTFYKNRYSEEDLIELIEFYEFEFIKFLNDYKDGNSKIIYKCKKGHVTERDIKYFIKFPTCKKCKIIERSSLNRGETAYGWKGGISKIWIAARARINRWTDDSLLNGNYTCAITRQKDVPIDVHHLRSFNLILMEVLNEFGYKFNSDMNLSNLKQGEIEKLLNRIVELNNEYGFGILLRKDIHILYHKIYKHGNNTPEQFYEFQQRIASGEIIIPT